jgi:hypothetical protein
MAVRSLAAVGALAAAAALAACDGESSLPAAGHSPPPPEPPSAETNRACRTAVYGRLAPAVRKHAVTVGPLSLLVADGGRPGEFEPSGIAKVLVLLRTGATATVVVPEDERRRVSLLYEFSAGPDRPLRFSDGTSSVLFKACTKSQEWGNRPYPDPRKTQFNGGFFVRGAHCAALEVWVNGRAEPARLRLGFGMGGRPCP